MSQLSLLLPPVAPPPSPFIAAASNEAALSWLERPALWPGGRLLVVAEAGAGKTHLLGDWAARSGGACVAGHALRFPPPAGRVLAVDDADRAAEETLLHALNATAEAGVPVLLSARRPAGLWGTRLPDLASRLRAVPVVEIGRAEDSLLRMLLAKMLAERQLAVPEAMRDWLLRHLPRSPAAIAAAAAALDRMLPPGGRLTHAWAAAIVEEVAATRPSEEA